MKYFLSLLALAAVLASCKNEKKQTEAAPEVIDIPSEIASAHGIDSWNEVNEIRFTFNFDRDSLHFERSWVWNPKTHQVSLITQSDSIGYNRKAVDSVTAKADAGFINDKYWLLAPFNLVWDRANFEHSYDSVAQAPMSGEKMQKLTIVYGSEGGYTPGDAYDFYFGDDYIIKEWVFRKSNQAEPSTMSTWEGYSELGGMKISLMHKYTAANQQLYFSGVEVN